MTQTTMTVGRQNAAAALQRWPDRFSPLAQVFHWVTAPLMICVLVLGWYMRAVPHDLPARQGWYDLHEATGVLILAITAVRLGWRWLNPPPSMPGHLGAIEQWGAILSHIGLYAVLLVMPISGYLLAMAKGHSLNFFWLFTVPQFVPSNADLAKAAQTVHVFGQYGVVGLIVLHVLATGWHVAVRRDGVLNRMLPPQDGGR